MRARGGAVPGVLSRSPWPAVPRLRTSGRAADRSGETCCRWPSIPRTRPSSMPARLGRALQVDRRGGHLVRERRRVFRCGAYVQDLAIDPQAPSTVYAAASSGIHRSDRRRRELGSDSTSGLVGARRRRAGPAHAGADVRGGRRETARRSTDAGTTWAPIGVGAARRRAPAASLSDGTGDDPAGA